MQAPLLQQRGMQPLFSICFEGGQFKVWPRGPDETAGPQKQHRDEDYDWLLTWLFTTVKHFLVYINLNKPSKEANRDILKYPKKSEKMKKKNQLGFHWLKW